jgi:thioredoxin 1
MTIINLKTTEFDKFIANAEVPVVVDYWATWCSPCKMVLPILEELSTDYEGKVIIAKVDVDAEPELMDGIRSVPTIRVFLGGKKVKELVGAKNKPTLLSELEEYLNA